MSSQAQTPTRRSQRFQPIVASTPHTSIDTALSWIGKPISVRPTNAADIHYEDEVALDDDVNTDTFFFEGFTRTPRSVTRTVKGKAKESGNAETYRLGDTVLVSSSGKLPSVGVIVSMWELREDKRDVIGKFPVKVKIHWFLRPSELAVVRARREHHDVCQFCSLAPSPLSHVASRMRYTSLWPLPQSYPQTKSSNIAQ